MSEESGPGVAAGEAGVVRRRGPSIVWVIPIVALLIGATIWWQTNANRGPEVTIFFEEGGGIEPGKTKVKYKGLEVGEVLEVGIRDIDTVEVTAELGLAWKRAHAPGSAVLSNVGGWLRYLPHPDRFTSPLGHQHYEVLNSTLEPGAALRLFSAAEALAGR